jgi:hypothetical protein
MELAASLAPADGAIRVAPVGRPRRAAVVVIGLAPASGVTGVGENQQRWTPRSLTVQEMVDLSAVLGARAMVLAQLVPNLQREPSRHEAQLFRDLALRCASERVQLLDCVVVSGERWWSLGRLLSEQAASN